MPTKPHDLPASDLGHDQASPSWTVRRVILLLPGGPQRIDFAAAIGRCDVEAAYAQAAEGLRNDFLALYGPEPLAWESLLQSPLLKSGWLGSVRPGSAITEMTSTRLDFNGNRHVDAMEFAAWLKNALAADPRFDLQESPRDEGAWENSPFGPLDFDGDHRLGQAELASGVERLPQFQPAEAARLSLADFQGPPIGDSPDSMMNRTPQLLEVRSFLIVQPPLWELLQYCAGSTDSKPRVDRQGTMPGDVPSEKRGKEEVELAAARPKSTEDSPRERLKRLDVAQRREVISVLQLLLQQYSYADTISRAQVDDWDDEQWNGADRDGDASLDAGELIAWLVGPADHRIRIELSSVSPAAAVKDDDTFRGAEQAQAEEQDSSSSSEANTVLIPDHAPHLRIDLPLGILLVTVDDPLSRSSPLSAVLRSSLAAALTDAKQRTELADALGLVSADDVFLVDRDGDRQLSDEEFHMAYRWLTWDASLRVEGVLEAPAARWFYLADLDGDGYLSGLERREWSRRLSELDTDQDGSLVPADLPMVVRAAVRRSPRRVAIPSANSSPREVEAPLPNWFTAMDMNGDGVVEPAEFLGESEDFRSYDRNQNRRIEPTEVYDALPNQ